MSLPARMHFLSLSYVTGNTSNNGISHWPRPARMMAMALAWSTRTTWPGLSKRSTLTAVPGLRWTRKCLRRLFGFALAAEVGVLAFVFGLLLTGGEFGGEGFLAGLLGLFAGLLELVDLGATSGAFAEVAVGPLQQVARHVQPLGDLQGTTAAELAGEEAIGRLEGHDVELDGGVLGAGVVEGVGLQVAQVRGDHGQALDLGKLVEDGPAKGGAFGGIGARRQFGRAGRGTGRRRCGAAR